MKLTVQSKGFLPFCILLLLLVVFLPIPAAAQKATTSPGEHELQPSPEAGGKPTPELYDLPVQGNDDLGDTGSNSGEAQPDRENQWGMPHTICDCDEFIQDDERLPALVVIMDNGGDCDEGNFELLLEEITRDWFGLHWDDPGYYEEYVLIEDPGIGTCGDPEADEYDAQRRIATELQNLNDAGYFMDIAVLTHGAYSNGISIIGNNMGSGNILDLAGEDRDKLAIRMVYQMNCFGSFLNDAWIELGAQVVSGSRYVNFLPIQFASVFNNLYLGDYACPISNIAGLAAMILPIPPLVAIANTAVDACLSTLHLCGWFAGDTYYGSVNDCFYDTHLSQEMADRIGNIVYNTKNQLIDLMEQEGFDAACDALGYDCDGSLSASQRASIVYWSSEPRYAGDTSISMYSEFEGSKNVGICDECPAIYDANADRSDDDSLPDVCDNCPEDENDD